MIKNNLKLERPLSKPDIETIHQNSLKILTEDGIKFDNKEILSIFDKHNFEIEDQKVFFDESIIEKHLATIPDSFILQARNPENSVHLGDNYSLLGPPLGPPFILEEAQQRYSTLEDYCQLIKIYQDNPLIDLVGGGITTPTDIDEQHRSQKMFFNAVKYSDKPLLGTGSGSQARDCLAMGETLMGKKKFKQPSLLKLIGVSSPLQYDQTPLTTLRYWAKYKQPLMIYTQILAGMSGPSSLAGVLTLQNAEILAGAVLTQLINPGTPVIYGVYSSVTDMNTGNITVGNGQYAKIISATTQMADFYNLPSATAGAITDAEARGARSGYESMLNLYTALGAGVDLILYAAGSINEYQGISFEKIISDTEMLKQLQELQSGIKIDKNNIAREVISEIGSEGNYLTHKHTLKHLENEKNQGARSQVQDKMDKIDKILLNYQKPQLDPEIEAKLKEYTN